MILPEKEKFFGIISLKIKMKKKNIYFLYLII